MHSHCFVRMESIYTPIMHEDDRQKYLSVPCFKGIDEVKGFFNEIAMGVENSKESESPEKILVNEIAL